MLDRIAGQLAGGVQAGQDLGRPQHVDQFGAGTDATPGRLGESGWGIDHGLHAGAQQGTEPTGVIAMDMGEDNDVDVPRIQAQLSQVVEEVGTRGTGVKEDGLVTIFNPGRKAPLGCQAPRAVGLIVDRIVIDYRDARLGRRLCRGGRLRWRRSRRGR